MPDDWGNIKDIAASLGKVTTVLGPVGSTLSAIYYKTSLGGKRIFEGFASINGISVNANLFKQPLLHQWVREIYSKPMTETPSEVLGISVISFLVLAIGLICHLLLKEKAKAKKSWYGRSHAWITLAIFMILLLCVFLSPTPLLMFLSLVLMLIFFMVYMYLNFKDIKVGLFQERLSWIFSLIIVVITVLILPSLYGQKFFDPCVICLDELDFQAKEIRTLGGKSVSLLFLGPKQEVCLGYLMKQLQGENEVRSLNLEENLTPGLEISTALKNKATISLKSLLAFKFVQAVEHAVSEDEADKLVNNLLN